jgi:2-haloacid dehalogenase
LSTAAPVTVEAIFFDAYGTLFDLSGVANACAAVAPRPDTFVLEWRRRQLEYSWLRSLMGHYADFEHISAEALAATAMSEGVQLDLAASERLLAAWLRPPAFPDATRALDALARHLPLGHRLGILSNGSPRMLATVLAHTGLADRFAWVLSVDAVKVYKPAPTVYALATHASGIEAERILFVSSNDWDIAGAAAFGFRTCWVNRLGRSPETLGFSPSHVVRSLEEIVGLVE